MEESLLIPKESLSSTSTTWDLLSGEVKKQGYIAAPMGAVTLSQYLLQVVSMMMVGHLGQLALSSTAASVTGFSVLLGMAICFPLSFLWIYMGRLLVLVGQDPQISHEVGKFIIWLLPALFAYAPMQALIRYFQSQIKFDHSHVLKLLCRSLFAYSHLLGFGIQVWTREPSRSIDNWYIVLVECNFLGNLHEVLHCLCRIQGSNFNGIVPRNWRVLPLCYPFCSNGLGCCLTHSLKLQSYLLRNIQTLSAIPYGLGAAVSTRISNELGAGNVQRARVAVYAVVFMAGMETIIVSASLFASRRVFGYVFSSERQVVDYVTTMAPLACLYVIMDSLQGVFSVVARGCGWQNIAAFFRGRGLWIGIQAGAFTQTLLLGIITIFTDWKKQASKARKRLSKGRSLADNIQ
ncbi:hypothetical protein CUMW_065900 [Citrus unshiu]|nr:hypothetical protein CUMW_065900 [Citrus unshiu]